MDTWRGRILVICKDGKRLSGLVRILNQYGAGRFDIVKVTDLNGEVSLHRASVPPVIIILSLMEAEDAVWGLYRVRSHLPKAKVIVQLNMYDQGKALMLLRLGAYEVFSSLNELWDIVTRASTL